jgi:hypothetical protein
LKVLKNPEVLKVLKVPPSGNPKYRGGYAGFEGAV